VATTNAPKNGMDEKLFKKMEVSLKELLEIFIKEDGEEFINDVNEKVFHPLGKNFRDFYELLNSRVAKKQRLVITPDGSTIKNIKEFDGKLKKLFDTGFLCSLDDIAQVVPSGLIVIMIKGGYARVLAYGDASSEPVSLLCTTSELDGYQIIEVGINNSELCLTSQNDVLKDKNSEFEKSCYDFDVLIGLIKPREDC